MPVFVFHARYKLKLDAEPTHGRAMYGTTDLEMLEIDTDDMTARLRPSGFEGGIFWASLNDLEKDS